MLHIHHILPYSRFPEMDNNMDNLLYICQTCHNNIHINPFVNIRLMKQVADRYGIDIGAKFDETDKSNIKYNLCKENSDNENKTVIL